jgi:hypothetical protein
MNIPSSVLASPSRPVRAEELNNICKVATWFVPHRNRYSEWVAFKLIMEEVKLIAKELRHLF